MLLHRTRKLPVEWGKSLVGTLAELCVENATLLVDLDDGRAGVVCDDAACRVAIESALLDQRNVPWSLLWQGVFVPDRDMRVNQGVGSRDVNQAIRVVSLTDPVQLKLLRLGLVIGVLDTFLDVSIKNALASLHRVDTACMGYLVWVSPCALQLLALHGADGLSISVGLAVDVAERLGVHRRGHEWVLHHNVAFGNGRGASSPGGADLGVFLGDDIAEGLGEHIRLGAPLHLRVVTGAAMLAAELLGLGGAAGIVTLTHYRGHRHEVLVDVAHVGAVEELGGRRLPRHKLETLLRLRLFADDLVPERMVLPVSRANHF